MIPDLLCLIHSEQLMTVSPLHWCLQAYYGLFLEGGRLNDVGTNILSLIIISQYVQVIAIV